MRKYLEKILLNRNFSQGLIELFFNLVCLVDYGSVVKTCLGRDAFHSPGSGLIHFTLFDRIWQRFAGCFR